MVGIINVFVKKYNILLWGIFTAIKAVISFPFFFSKGFSKDIVSYLTIAYSEHNNSFFYILLFYLSPCIVMLAALISQKRPICEEYYYTRVPYRSYVAWGKIVTTIIAVSSLQIVDTFTTTFLFCFFGGTFNIPILFLLTLLGKLIMPRVLLALILLLSSMLPVNMMVLFTVMTGIILGEITIKKAPILLFWIHSLDFTKCNAYTVSILVTMCILLIIIIVRRENTRDIISQGEVEKNE